MKQIVTTPTADIALRNLTAEDARKVFAWFDRLSKWDEDETVRKNSHLLETVPGVYVLKTTTDLRIFFQLEGNKITILDVGKKPAILISGHIPEAG